MRQYVRLVQMGISEALLFPLDIFFQRLRRLVGFGILMALWFTLTQRGDGTFGLFGYDELVTYTILLYCLRPFIFAEYTRGFAQDLASGEFSQILLKPLSHYTYYYLRGMGVRLIDFGFSLFEVGFYILLFRPPFVVMGISTIFLFLISCFLAHVLFILLDYCINCVVFWSQEVEGPKFVFSWLLSSTSGMLCPLAIFPLVVFLPLLFLPFSSIAYGPMALYLHNGGQDIMVSVFIIGLQIFWIVTSFIVAHRLFKKGMRHFSGDSI